MVGLSIVSKSVNGWSVKGQSSANCQSSVNCRSDDRRSVNGR